MSSLPSLPLFTDAYIADTAHLTCEEHGAYLRLLMFAWRSPGCSLPDDDARLARMLGLSAKRWVSMKPIVMAFWTLIDGNWTQKRLTRERQFAEAKYESKRAAGRLGGRPKSLANKETGEAIGSETEKQIESKPKAPNPNPITPIVPTGDDPPGFAEFRAAYPKRNVAFPTTLARKRWLEARRRGAEPAAIIAGAGAYAAEQARIGKVGTEFVKTADSWLHQGRWQDYAKAAAEPTAAAPVADDTWRDRVRRWKETGGHWPWRQSAPPDSHDTAVPARVLAEFGLGQVDGFPTLKLAGAR